MVAQQESIWKWNGECVSCHEMLYLLWYVTLDSILYFQSNRILSFPIPPNPRSAPPNLLPPLLFWHMADQTCLRLNTINRASFSGMSHVTWHLLIPVIELPQMFLLQ